MESHTLFFETYGLMHSADIRIQTIIGIARQLNGRINCFRGVGRLATWYVPAVIGLYNVYEASPEMRVRTLFEEGFGIVGGALGTKAGTALGLGIVAVLGLGPLGLFITVFICASVGGMAGSALFKEFGSGLNNYIFNSENDKFNILRNSYCWKSNDAYRPSKRNFKFEWLYLGANRSICFHPH